MKQIRGGRPALAAGLAMVGFSVMSGLGATWVGTEGPFTNAVNWDTGTVPTSGVPATVDNGGTSRMDGGGAWAGTVTLGEAAGTAGTLAVSAGVLTNAYLFAGKAGTGTVEQTGGEVVVSASADPSLGLGYAASGSGTYRLSGGCLNMLGSGNLQVGAYGSGTFTQSGGAVTGRGWMVVGRYGPAGSGQVTVSGGEFCQGSTAHRLIIAEGGAGLLVVTNAGRVVLDGGLRVGMVKNNPPNDAGTGTGTVWLCQGGTLATPEVRTQGGSSTFNFDGGVLAARGNAQTYGGFFEGLSAAYVRAGGAVVDSGNNGVTINQSLLDGGGGGGLVKTGEGSVTLGGANAYAGRTVVSNGYLSAATAAALPGYGEDGRVEVCDGAGLAVGIGAGQWSETDIGLLLSHAAFGAGSVFGFDTASGNVTLGTSLDSPLGLLKMGLNTLKLTGNNSYTGATRVVRGVLQADFGAGLPASTNVTLAGGTLSTESGNLTLALGTGAGQINIVSNKPAGFSAYGVPLTVNLGGAGAALAWGSAVFSPNALLLNEVGADQPLTFCNGLDLCGGARSIEVNATATGTGVTIAGNIADTVGGGGLTKGGAGALTWAGTNVYTGITRAAAGVLTLDPASSNSVGEMQVSGSARLNVGGATLKQTAGNFVVYGGSVDVRGGIVSNLAGSAYVGYNSGAGSLMVDAGYVHIPNELNVGTWPGSTGNLTLSNGTVAARLLYVGRGGNGTVTQTGGTMKLTGAAGGDGWRIGGWSDTTAKGTGVYNLFNGTLDTGANNLQIGCSGSGTLYQKGGTASCGGWPVIGRFSGGTGVYTLEGGTFSQTSSGNKLIVAEVGTGTLNLRGTGVVNLVGGLLISTASGSAGTVNLEAGGTLLTPSVAKGGGPSATFNFDGGTLRVRNSGATLPSFMQGLNAANVKSGGAVIDSSNNVVTVAQSLRSGALPDGGVTKRGAGTLVLAGTNTYNGVTRIEAGTLRVGHAAAITNNGAVTLTGGCYDLGSCTVTHGAVAVESGSVVNGTLVAGALTVSEGTVLANLTGAGSLTKAGSGTVVLCGTNTYTGTTRVEAGTLKVGTLPLHRWSFNGDLRDSVGHSDATAVGTVTSDGAQYTLAGDGTRGSSYLNLGPNILPADGATPVTVELWATENVVRPWSRIFDFGSNIDNNMFIVWYAGYTDSPSWVEVKVGGTVIARTIEVPRTYAVGTQYHIAFELIPGAGTGGTVLVKWFVMDGAGTTLKAGSMDANFSVAAFVQQNMWLGHSEYSSDPDGNASYNEVRIWPRALSEAQLAQNSILGPDALPALAENTLSTQSQVSVAAGAALDLGGSSQTISGLSGNGTVSNGTLAVTGTLAPGGTNAVGTLTVAASASLTGTLLADVAADGASDCLQVAGALDLRGLALHVQNADQLKPRMQYLIATCAPGALTGPFESTNLDASRWSVSYRNAGGEVRLVSSGLLITVK